MRTDVAASLGRVVLAVWLVIAGGTPALAGPDVVTGDFGVVRELVQGAVERYGARQVLVATDIDHTVLVLNQDLGSEPWFDWQAELLKQYSDTTTPAARREEIRAQLAATDFGGLLRLGEKVFALSHARPVDASVPVIYSEIQSWGVATIAVTARGPADHDYTLRHLRESRVLFASHSLEPKEGIAGAFLPYQPQRAEQAGLTAEEVGRLGLNAKTPKPVRFNDGVLLTEGQNKGVMLVALLKRLSAAFKAVIFVDNKVSPLKQVRELLDPRTDLTTVRYTIADADRDRFVQGDKSAVIEAARRFQALESELFPAVEKLR